MENRIRSYAGIWASSITAGPNKGLWMVDSVNAIIYGRGQIRKDHRSDANLYAVTTADTLYPAFTWQNCALSGQLGSPAVNTNLTVAAVNNNCYPGSAFSADWTGLVLYNKKHETCHLKLLEAGSDSTHLIPNGRAAAEPLSDTTEDNLKLRVRDELVAAAEAAFTFTKRLDSAVAAPSFDYARRTSTNTAWTVLTTSLGSALTLPAPHSGICP